MGLEIKQFPALMAWAGFGVQLGSTAVKKAACSFYFRQLHRNAAIAAAFRYAVAQYG